jgi:uncharacterized delta-60 repeat protein
MFLVFASNAQNAADIDQTIGSGYVGFSQVSEIAVQPDGKIIVAGFLLLRENNSSFQGRLARFNTDGSIDTTFQTLPIGNEGIINDIVLQPDGKILVGGSFNNFNGTAVNKLLRLNADGSMDTNFNYTIGAATINSIALQQDGKVLVAGSLFVTFNGYSQRLLIRLNSDGSLDTSFAFGFTAFPSFTDRIYKVAVQPDGKILAAGTFETFNGTPQGRIIRFNTDGTKDTSFNIGTGATGGTGLRDLVIQPDGKILIGGNTVLWNNQATDPIHRIHPDGSLDTTFVLGVSSTYFYRLAIQSDGKIAAIGLFTINGSAQRVTKLNSDGSLDSTFVNKPISNAINCLDIQTDDKMLIGGYMNEYDGVKKNGFARVETNGNLDTTFNLNTGLNNEVNTIALQSDGKALLGGDFTTFDGVSQNKIIRINDNGTKDNLLAIGSGFNNTIENIKVQSDGKILVAGSFTTFNGTAANSLIRLNNDGTRDNSFTIGTGFNDYVQVIILQPDGKIILGGNFTQFDGQTQNYCIRLNADGTKDSSFSIDTALNNRVTSIVLQSDGKIILGGNFITFNGLNQNKLVRVNPDGTKDTTYDIGSGINTSNSDASVDLVCDMELLPDGKIFISAPTSSYNNLGVGIIFRLNTNGSLDTTFIAGASIGSGRVEDIALQQDGKIIIGTSRRKFMRLNMDGNFDSSFDINIGAVSNFGGLDSGGCNVIAIQPDGKIWLGGSFFSYIGVSSFSAIRLVGDSVLSINDNESSKDSLILYPNPVEDILYINKTVNSILITELTGKTVAKIENVSEIDFSILANGLYILSIENDNGKFTTHKISKK